MSDPGSIAAAYGVVLGGLALYVISLGRRLRRARRTAASLDRERRRDAEETALRTGAVPSEPRPEGPEPVR